MFRRMRSKLAVSFSIEAHSAAKAVSEAAAGKPLVLSLEERNEEEPRMAKNSGLFLRVYGKLVPFAKYTLLTGKD